MSRKPLAGQGSPRPARDSPLGLVHEPGDGRCLKYSAATTAVQKTCATGYAWNYSGSTQTDATGHSIPNKSQTNDKLANNYPWLFSVDVPSGVSLANQQAVNMPTRGAAIPIIFALYKVILISVDLRHAPFWGWIHDLSAPDPTTCARSGCAAC